MIVLPLASELLRALLELGVHLWEQGWDRTLPRPRGLDVSDTDQLVALQAVGWQSLPLRDQRGDSQ